MENYIHITLVYFLIRNLTLLPETHKWRILETAGDRPTPRTRSRAVVFQDKMYLLGGVSNAFVKDFLYEFDFKTCKWKKMQPAANIRGVAQTDPVIYKDLLVFFGGSGPEERVSDSMFALKIGDPNNIVMATA
jgi:hypothetical protein